jgi:hypothetical protein
MSYERPTGGGSPPGPTHSHELPGPKGLIAFRVSVAVSFVVFLIVLLLDLETAAVAVMGIGVLVGILLRLTVFR